MKKIKYIVAIWISGMLFASCQDWLEVKSETKFDKETAFETISKAEMTVIGCYPNIFDRELYYQFGMGTDACISTESDTNSKNQVSNYVYNPSNIPTASYGAMYAGIECANICIKNLKEMKGNTEAEQKKIEMLLGESYAIRAMNYFNLVRFFGDVPYPTIPTADQKALISSRVSRDEIMDGCIADLQEAVKLLPWLSEGMITTPERFSKNAAYGILARIALYSAGYSLRWDLNTYSPSSVKLAQREDAARIKELYAIARDACYAVMGKKENNLIGYETVFRDLVNGRYNKETMLEYGQYGPNANSSAIGYTNGMYAHTDSKFNKAQPAMHVLATYWYDFEEGDTRRDVAICNYGIASNNIRQMNTYSSNTIGKFRAVWKKEIGTAANRRDINWPFLRYSDVLLMYAEAENEVNGSPTDEAKAALKNVRLRAFNNDETKIGTIPSGYEEFKQAIINERHLELAFEGLRRTDLIRWGILFETLTKTKQNVIDMADKTGRYTQIDLYRAYKKEMAEFDDPLVSVPYIAYKLKPTAEEINKLGKDGYILLEMHGKTALSFSEELKKNSGWVVSLFRGLEKNKVELFPLNSTTIDVNPGLKGQQHPLY